MSTTKQESILLKTRVILINKNKEELLSNSPDEIFAKAVLDLTDAYAIREDIDDNDEIDPDRCVVYFRNGEMFTVTTPFLEVMKLKYSK